MGLHRELVDAFQRGEERARAAEVAERTLVVTALPTRSGVYAGADSLGSCVLAVVTTASSSPPSHVRMAVLAAEFGAAYLLDDGGQQQEIRTSVVRCNSDDPEIRELFASFCASVISAIPAAPSERDLASEVDKWLGLFWRLQTPTRTDVVGLVGELAVIMTAPNPATWVRGWHSDPMSTIDFVFSSPHLEVEVKATRSPTRVHQLSADQAFGQTNRYVASVHVDLRSSGISIRDATLGIEDRLSHPEDVHRFREVLAAECGTEYPEFMRERFVPEVSYDSLWFFRIEDIPRPEIEYPLPVGVRAMSFVSDFTGAPSLTPSEFFTGRGVDQV